MMKYQTISNWKCREIFLGEKSILGGKKLENGLVNLYMFSIADW